MADPPPDLDAGDDIGVGPDHGSTTGTPGWVKVFGVIALVVVVLFVILLLTGRGGEHGPGRHTAEPRGHTPPSSVTGHTPPSTVEHGERQL